MICGLRTIPSSAVDMESVWRVREGNGCADVNMDSVNLFAVLHS